MSVYLSIDTEAVAKAIWDSQQEGMERPRSWRTNALPEQIWEHFMKDAEAAVDEINRQLQEQKIKNLRVRSDEM